MTAELFILDHLSIIRIAGSAVQQFLQGQITGDIHEVNDTHGLFTAICDPKGRMLATFFIWQQNTEYFLLLPTAIVELTISHLKKFAVFSKTTVLEMIDLMAVVHEPQIKMTDWAQFTIPFLNGRYLSIGNNQEFSDQISKHANTNAYNTWQLFNIAHGIVWIHPETRGILIPQMINLQKLGGVSFKKGCYIGQEIVARTEHLGKLKRHLYVGEMHSDQSPLLGSELLNDNQQPVGIIVSTALKEKNKFLLLMVLQDQLITATLYLGQDIIKNLRPVLE